MRNAKILRQLKPSGNENSALLVMIRQFAQSQLWLTFPVGPSVEQLMISVMTVICYFTIVILLIILFPVMLLMNLFPVGMRNCITSDCSTRWFANFMHIHTPEIIYIYRKHHEFSSWDGTGNVSSMWSFYKMYSMQDCLGIIADM